MALSLTSLAISGSIFFIVCWALQKCLDRTQSPRAPEPPFVPLTQNEIYNAPIEPMTKALREHGPLVAIERDGKREYLVSDKYTNKVLTDESSFSFEGGMAEILGIHWIRYLHGGTFFRDLDNVIREFATRNIDQAVPQVWAIFDQGAFRLAKSAENGQPIDIRPIVESVIAKAVAIIFLGKKYNNPETEKIILKVAKDVAELFGLSRRESILGRRFPRIWRIYTLVRIALIQIPLDLGPKFAWSLWAEISADESKLTGKNETIFHHLVRRYTSKDGHLSFTSRVWIFVLALAVVFGSVHQTIVIIIWVTYFLALHPECQEMIHGEFESITANGDSKSASPSSDFDYEKVKKAVGANSFIREVLRMKGDSVNTIRLTVKDVVLGGYTIPKGYAVYPVTYLSYRSKDYYSDPDVFNGKRWVGSGKTAATTGPDYLAFGLGRWACPGRYLAVVELQCWILAMVKYMKIGLDGGKYEVVDAFNVTALAPKGRLLVRRR